MIFLPAFVSRTRYRRFSLDHTIKTSVMEMRPFGMLRNKMGLSGWYYRNEVRIVIRSRNRYSKNCCYASSIRKTFASVILRGEHV